jgi:glycosyltransferase involved in cell wall biosynthesis
VRHTENQGVCRSRNDAFEHIVGDYVAATSADDVWLPEHLARAVDLIQRLPRSTGLVYGDAYCIDEDGRRRPQMFIESYGNFHTMPEGFIYEDLLRDNFIPAMTVLARRECYEAAGPYDETLVYEDWDMWLRLAKRYEFAFSPYVGASYRVVSGSLSRRRERLLESAIRVLLKHIGYSREWDAVLWKRIAWIAYEIDHPQRREYLKISLRHNGWRHSAFLYGLTACRVPHRWITPVWEAPSKLWERLRVARERPRTI